MRIVYIHQYFTTRSMPGGTRSFEQAKRLVNEGHEVHVVTSETTGRRGFSWRETIEDGIHVHWLPVPYSNRMRFRQRLQAFGQFAALGSIEATRIGGDVVFATSTPLTVAVPGLIASRLRRARFVFEVRDLWPELPIEMGDLRNFVAIRVAFALARAAYRHADHVVALSPGMADGVAAHGYPPERLSIVPNASDLDLFASADEAGRRFRAEQPWLGNRPLVVYLGTFGRVNGVGYLVRVAAAMASLDPEVRFLLVGAGAEFDSVRELAAELGVLDRNLFMSPPYPKTAMPALLGAATLATSVVIPVAGLEANCANKVFDAFAAGRPLAINHGGWQADLLRESGAGLALPAHDPIAAASQLHTHIHDDEWLSQARFASSRLAHEEFSRDLLFKEFNVAVTGTSTNESSLPSNPPTVSPVPIRPQTA